MDSRFETKGFEDAQKMLESIGKSVDPSTLDEWIELVSKVAKQICDDPEGEHIKIVKTGQGQYNFPADRKSIDCVIQSIQQQFNLMPQTQQEYFKIVMTSLEAKKRE
jgi:hypothetical protein